MRRRGFFRAVAGLAAAALSPLALIGNKGQGGEFRHYPRRRVTIGPETPVFWNHVPDKPIAKVDGFIHVTLKPVECWPGPKGWVMYRKRGPSVTVR